MHNRELYITIGHIILIQLVLLKCVHPLETVRQMLGLEEEQVAEISGDNSKYEVSKIMLPT